MNDQHEYTFLTLTPQSSSLLMIRPYITVLSGSLILVHFSFTRSCSGILTFLTMFCCSLNLMLLFVCFPGISNPGPRSLDVLFNNVRGFVHTANLGKPSPDLCVSKVLEFQDYIYSNTPDIIIINETWLKSNIKSSEIFPHGYKVFRLDRCAATHPFDPLQPKKFRTNGGGVLIAHRDNLAISSYKFEKFSTQAEVLSVVINSHNISFCISTFYRVSTLSYDNLFNFKSYMQNLSRNRSFKRHILVGDFNLPSVVWPDGTSGSALERDFIDFLCGELGHSQLVSSPTHISSNTLDLLFTNCPELVKQLSVCDVNQVCCSDHFGLKFRINLKCDRSSRLPRYRYDFRNFDFLSLNVAFARVNWDLIIDDNVNDSWRRVKSVIVELCDKYIPKKRVKDPFTPSWHSDRDVVRARNRKETLRSRFKSRPSPESKAAYYLARKALKTVISTKLNDHFNVDESCITKRFWTHIKLSSKSLRVPECVCSNGIFRSESREKANLFNRHFASQFTSPSQYGISIDRVPECDIFFSQNEVFVTLASTDGSKACGDDGISGRVLKNCAGSLSYPLWLLFNLSMRSGIIADDWKLASIVPVFKKGDRREVANYRPISLLSLVSKTLERLVKPRLLDVCSPQLDPRQHGFLSGKSCTTQLIPFTHSLAEAFDEKERVDIVYFDFSRAFDSCNHDLILDKLKFQFGVDGQLLSFIKSYLSNRSQKVVLDGESSDVLPVLSGVPQGSILGPILFVIFINDIFHEVTNDTCISLYADDTKVWRRIVYMTDHILLQKTIDNLYNWSVRNLMHFHPAKCHVLSVGNPSLYLSNPLTNLPFFNFIYSLGGVELDYVSSQRDLGVVICENLNFNYHCESILSTMVFKFNLLRRSCFFLKRSCHKRTLYLSMVRSLVEHCNQVWSNLNVGSFKSLEKLQKRAVKWIRNEPLASYTNDQYVEHLLSLNLLPFKHLFQFYDLRLFYKIVFGMVDISLPVSISPEDPDSLYPTRQNIDIIEGRDVTSLAISSSARSHNVLNGSFFFRTTILWNKLPYEIRQSTSLYAFNRSVKEYLFKAIEPELLL